MEKSKVPHDIMNYQAIGKRNSGRPLKSLLDSDIETGSGHLAYVPEYDSWITFLKMVLVPSSEEGDQEVHLLCSTPRKISRSWLGMCSSDVNVSILWTMYF